MMTEYVLFVKLAFTQFSLKKTISLFNVNLFEISIIMFVQAWRMRWNKGISVFQNEQLKFQLELTALESIKLQLCDSFCVFTILW